MQRIYQAEYMAFEPVWGELRVRASDPEEAIELAEIEIAQMYPEYSDIVIETLEEVDID